MDTRTLPEMAGDTLVAAFSSDRADEVFGAVCALFERWQVARPEGLYLQTRRSAPGERAALAAAWQQVVTDVLAAHPAAEPELRALIERARRVIPPPPPPPPAPPAPPAGPAGRPDSPPGGGRAPAGKTSINSYGGAHLWAFPQGAPQPGSPDGLPGRPRRRGGSPGRGGGERTDKASRPGADLRDPVSRAIQSAVRPGVLAFNPPSEMTQGRADRVEVAVARSADLVDALVSGLRGRGEVRVEPVPTSAFMSAELRGDSFAITALSPAEQIVAPTARWEFDVTPRHAGVQTLTLCVSMRFSETGPLAVPGSRIAVPVIERQIRIKVSVGYGTRAFVGQNWQWLVGTAVAIGGAVAAFLAVVH